MNEYEFDIILQYLHQRDIKNKAIRSQSYAIAAQSRDSERLKARDFYNLINNCEDETFDWVKYDRFLKEWFEEKYSLNIYQVDSIQVFKLMNRDKNLNDLLNGI
jgi:septum formation inhibitor-activating ATPase MinD